MTDEQTWPTRPRPQASPVCPRSANHWLVSPAHMLAIAGALILLTHRDMFDTIEQSFLFVCGAGAVAALAVGWITGSGRLPLLEAPTNDGSRLPRCLVKLAGVAATLGIVAFAYWTLPVYATPFFDRYWHGLRLAWPILLLAPPYIWLTDRRMAQPRDGYWAMGMLAMGRWSQVDFAQLWQHMLGWVVKAFFLPLMLLYACDGLSGFLGSDPTTLTDHKQLYDYTIDTLYLCDVLVAATGYAVSLRLFDTHIRSVEPTPLGWAIALACYQPFYDVIGASYISYDVGRNWTDWLKDWPLAFNLWAAIILILVAVYAWATFAIGCRFSNITHRGIITNGPYRWTRHPAYVAKNLSWWMISLPFLADSFAVGLRACCCLLLLNFIYYLRARTEERHLSLDPVYRDYSAWMDRNGPLRRMPKILPNMISPLPRKRE